ncbi:MAG: 6-carboxytetrahydropterin synthase QueD [Desulfobacteraceae bacterium 4572_130]|nr:MAG: 6-carboxytetrahydropterin synthase QueD [Desulfobacteraceae bacterium 4572_130]
MFELKVKNRFAAAHNLTMVGEKCENLHGHNWNIEVCILGNELNQAGVLIDFGIIKKAVKKIIKTFDHKYLNEIKEFKNIQPSSEQIAIYIAKQLKIFLSNTDPNIKVSKVSAWESENACATYIP